ncbi:MAG TPA: diguanylate cyclase [Candidatus Baltobacteraceae bacterium]|nr:diguanylate cyclase [Candidatus Baltobacteraceae bacterium]
MRALTVSHYTRRVLAAGLAAFALFIFVCLLVGVYQFRLVRESLLQQAIFADATVAERDRVLQLVNEETGVRAYAATSDPSFLDIYYRSFPQYAADERPIRAVVAADPALRAANSAVERTSARLRGFLRAQIALVASGRAANGEQRFKLGKALMDRTRAQDAVLESRTAAALDRQRSHTRALVDAGFLGGLALCGLLLVCAALIALLWRRGAHYQVSLTRDALTGVSNRGAAIAAMRRYIAGGVPFGVVFIDLDGFKKINDVYGHAAGDAILKSVAARLEHELREGDLVSRIGGDEFVCVIAQPAGAEHAVAIAARLRKAVSKPYRFESDNYVVGASAGVAIYPEHGTSPEALLARADRAMYAQKFAAAT